MIKKQLFLGIRGATYFNRQMHLAICRSLLQFDVSSCLISFFMNISSSYLLSPVSITDRPIVIAGTCMCYTFVSLLSSLYLAMQSQCVLYAL